ncbi:MAG: CBS domain-containing protein [Armatimonadota bacterium]
MPNLPADIAVQSPNAGQLVRSVAPLGPEETVRKVVHQFRQHGLPAIPVVNGLYLLGWVTEARVAQYLMEEGSGLDDSLLAVLEPITFAVQPEASLEDVLAIFQAGGESLLPVVGAGGTYLGSIVRADALAARSGYLTPPRIGGMATPLGVYLTTGTVNGGVGPLGLILTGMLLTLMLWVVQNVLMMLTAGIYHVTRLPLLLQVTTMLAESEPQGTSLQLMGVYILSTTLLIVSFLALLRVFPLIAGYHAAEHQTVNAIEAGEPLTTEAVRRMPRVHPRCGTNLVGLLQLGYLGTALVAMILATQVGRENLPAVASLALFVVLLVVVTWKRFGAWLQTYFTTRPATERELASGIQAGHQILRRHLANPVAPPLSLGARIWRMGLLQVILGAITMGFVLQLPTLLLDGLWQILVK